MSRFVELLSDKEKREGRRYKQVEIQQATGVAPSTISSFLKGTVDVERINIGTARRLAQWLGVPIDTLVYEEREDGAA